MQDPVVLSKVMNRIDVFSLIKLLELFCAALRSSISSPTSLLAKGWALDDIDHIERIKSLVGSQEDTTRANVTILAGSVVPSS